MKKKELTILLGFVLFYAVLTSISWAGQVVTKDVKQWAKEAIEQISKANSDQ